MKAFGLLGLRLAIGIIFIYMGYGKLGPNHAMATGLFSGMGLPGSAAAYVVGLLEMVGGLMVLLGVFAGTAAMWLAIIMIVAMLTVHKGGPFMGYFLPLAVLGGCLGLIGTGAGAYRLVKMECHCAKCKSVVDGGCSTEKNCGDACGDKKENGCCEGKCGGACGEKK